MIRMIAIGLTGGVTTAAAFVTMYELELYIWSWTNAGSHQWLVNVIRESVPAAQGALLGGIGILTIMAAWRRESGRDFDSDRGDGRDGKIDAGEDAG